MAFSRKRCIKAHHTGHARNIDLYDPEVHRSPEQYLKTSNEDLVLTRKQNDLYTETLGSLLTAFEIYPLPNASPNNGYDSGETAHASSTGLSSTTVGAANSILQQGLANKQILKQKMIHQQQISQVAALQKHTEDTVRMNSVTANMLETTGKTQEAYLGKLGKPGKSVKTILYYGDRLMRNDSILHNDDCNMIMEEINNLDRTNEMISSTCDAINPSNEGERLYMIRDALRTTGDLFAGNIKCEEQTVHDVSQCMHEGKQWKSPPECQKAFLDKVLPIPPTFKPV